jgi:hypothetical protein
MIVLMGRSGSPPVAESRCSLLVAGPRGWHEINVPFFVKGWPFVVSRFMGLLIVAGLCWNSEEDNSAIG